MDPLVLTAGIAAIVVAGVAGALIVLRVRRGRRVAAEHHRAEEALREEVLERFRHVRAEWDGPEDAAPTTQGSRIDLEPTGRLPVGLRTSDEPWEGPAHVAPAARPGRAARASRVARVALTALALLALALVVAAALTWFTSR